MSKKESEDQNKRNQKQKSPYNYSSPEDVNKDQNQQSSDKDPKNKKPRFNIYWIYGLIALGFILINFFSAGQGAIETNRQRFVKEMLKNHDVSKVIIVTNQKMVEVYLKKEKLNDPKYSEELADKTIGGVPESGPHYYFQIGSIENFEQRLEEAQSGFSEDQKIEIYFEERTNYFKEIFGWLLPIIILVAIWIFIFKRMSGGGAGGGGNSLFNVGKSKAQLFDKESNVNLDFADVAGLEEAKVEVKELVDFLKNPQKYTDLGGKIPKGALLVGPPGTGKTLLAKAVAGEANVPFFSISGSDFVEMFVGVGASRVRDLFKQAKEKAPCIVFIDEIDAIGRARGKNPNMGANDERENTLNALLTEMDGFAPNTGVILMAATNRADMLDKALLRAGRFDRQINVELPDLKEREEIFSVHVKPLKLAENVDLHFLAKQTPGFSGADIANVSNEAALIAARQNKKNIEKQDFLDAVDRIIGGLERKNKIISKLEKKTIAYHEAGHAAVSWKLKHGNPLVKVTIIPRGRALGAAWYLPEERQITTTEQMMDELVSALGGRASEEIIFGRVSTGALNDLERVTKQAYAMVSYFGMSDKVGNISYYDSSGQSEYMFKKPYSEKTAEMIDNEVKSIIANAYEKAKKTLEDNKENLIKLADLLLEREVIFGEDLERIFGKREFEEEEKALIKNGENTGNDKKQNEASEAENEERNESDESENEEQNNDQKKSSASDPDKEQSESSD